MKPLEGKVALVSGGGRGIGRAVALKLASEGANIVTFSRTKAEIKKVHKEILTFCRKSIVMVADVRKNSDIKNVVNAALKKFGKIDILINNAGVAMLKLSYNMNEKEWDDIIDTNLKGVFLCCKNVLPIMLKKKSGVIVNVSSLAGRAGFPKFSVYCASKFGVIGFTESISQEVKNKGIKVYSVCPSSVDTKMCWDLHPEKKLNNLFLKPEYIAEKILELCLSNCNVSSGSIIEIHR